MIEKGHKLLINTLSKMTNKELRNWVNNLPAVLWANRSIVRRSTGHTPFYLFYNREPVLPIELKVPTWRIFPWDEVHDTAELLTMRARQSSTYNVSESKARKSSMILTVFIRK
jgi:hypothetical protein